MKTNFFKVVTVCALFCSCATTGRKLDTVRYEYYVGMEKVSANLVKSLVKLTPDCKVAVLPLTSQYGNKTMLGDNIANVLQSLLFNPKKYALVERERVDSIISELEFSRSALVDEEGIKRLGKLLAVDSIVIGTLRHDDGYFSLYCKVVDVETGKVQAIASVLLDSTETMIKQYALLTDKKIGSIQGAYELVVKKMQVREANHDGIAWDAFSRPDLVVAVSIDGADEVRSPGYQDMVEAECNVVFSVVLKENSVLEVYVYDEDVTKFEKISRFILTPDMIRELIESGGKVYSDDDTVGMDVGMRRL